MTEQTIDCLLADVGGTNVRFAWQARAAAGTPGAAVDANVVATADAPLTDIAVYPCAQHDSLQAAIAHYLHTHNKPNPQWCAIGMANPVLHDEVRMTNLHWSFSIAGLARQLGVERLRVINDFTALALALPALASSDLRRIGGGAPVHGGTMALLGPGTGLGVSGLVQGPHGQYLPVSGEGGHVSLSAHESQESAVVQWLMQRFGHASAERALSGPGLRNLYQAICEIAGTSVNPYTPADVMQRAQAASDPACVQALALFCSFLGSVAGNLALTLGSTGGVYVGGGMAPRITTQLSASLFRVRFEGKGRFAGYLQAIPTFVIDSAVPAALLGAARALASEK